MMLLDPKAYRKLFIRTFPASKRQQVDRVLDNCEDAIAGWFIGILFKHDHHRHHEHDRPGDFGYSPGLLPMACWPGCWHSFPTWGPFISVIPPTAIALLEAPWKAVAVVILYIVIQQLESNILTPLVMKRQVSLLPAVTLLSQVIFVVFFGFLGLLLALPLVLIFSAMAGGILGERIFRRTIAFWPRLQF